MTIFEKEKFSTRSKMTAIEIDSVIEDIKYSSPESEYTKEIIEEGYLPFIKVRDNFNGDTCYYIKPTEEVQNYMKKSGYGKAEGVEYSDISKTISFHAIWSSSSITMTTTPQIAGVLNQEELYARLKELPYKGECQVNKAYSNMYACEPNYALPSINITGNKLDKMKNLNRKIWLAAGFMLKDKNIIESAEKGELDLAFKDSDKMKFLKDNFEFDKPFYIPKNKVKNTKKIGIN